MPMEKSNMSKVDDWIKLQLPRQPQLSILQKLNLMMRLLKAVLWHLKLQPLLHNVAREPEVVQVTIMMVVETGAIVI